MVWFTTDWFSSYYTVRCANKSGYVINFTTVACRISSWLKWYKNYKNRLTLAIVIPYILTYKSLPRISRPPKNWVHMLSKIIDPCISRRYSKVTTCCIIVRILGGFYDARLKCSIVRRSLSLRCSSHFRQMWLQVTRLTRPAIGADITWHTGLLVAAKPEMAAAGVLY